MCGEPLVACPKMGGMQAELDQRGFFWLQGSTSYADVRIPDSAKSGRLTIDGAGVIQLQVDGDLGFNIRPIQVFTGFEPDLPADQLIAGYLNDGQRAFLYELSVGDFEGVTGGTIVSQSFEAPFCLIAQDSIHDQPATTAIRSLQIRAGELDDWMHRATVKAEVIEQKPEDVSVKVSYDRTTRSFALPMGELHLAKLTSDPALLVGPYSSQDLTFRQETLVQLTLHHEQTLAKWRRALLDIEELFALLLGSYFDLEWPSLICPHADGKDWFKFYFRRDGAVRSSKPAIHTALLMWMWVEESFGSTLAAWIDFKRSTLRRVRTL
jgi:ApeA N-terminal domain 1